MPCAAGLGGSASFGRVLADRELLIGSFVAVPLFASTHRDIAGAIKNRWDRLEFKIRWAQVAFFDFR